MIEAITKLTHVMDVIVIAHSQGGLVARSYIEGFAVPWSNLCQDGYACLANPLRTKYAQDIGRLITLDTPHSGADIEKWVDGLNLNFKCQSVYTLNRRELNKKTG